MPQNIHQNNVRSLYLKCIFDEYYDFMLHKGECTSEAPDIGCIVADIDVNGIDKSGDPNKNGKLYSSVVWDNAVNGGVSLKDIGIVGVDNGFIHYDKDMISNDEFKEIYTKSVYNIESGDTRFFLSPVTGNTKNHIYPYEIHDDYFSFKGGFFQGFYKLYGFDYQTLPNRIVGSEWNLYFNLRPRSDYQVEQKTLNAMYPENSGIFFYMGTRAENKFWEYYHVSPDTLRDLTRESVLIDGYLSENCLDGGYVKACDATSYLTEYAGEDCSGESLNYLYDPCRGENTPYLKEQGKIDESGVTMSDGTEFNAQDLVRIETDNKFITFNRTQTGITVHTYTESADTKTIEYTKTNGINLFEYMNRTETGYTKDTIDELLSESGISEYNVYENSINNTIAFRITDDGRVGYKTISCPLSDVEKYEVKEEYSKPNIVKKDEWNNIVVKFKISESRGAECDKGIRRMRIYFYVNGYLVFISKEMNELNFRELDDLAIKQEGVPYNISIGGGSFGLLETIWPDYYRTDEYVLPIEKAFAGTFLGDIKKFKFINCSMDYNAIRALGNN